MRSDKCPFRFLIRSRGLRPVSGRYRGSEPDQDWRGNDRSILSPLIAQVPLPFDPWSSFDAGWPELKSVQTPVLSWSEGQQLEQRRALLFHRDCFFPQCHWHDAHWALWPMGGMHFESGARPMALGWNPAFAVEEFNRDPNPYPARVSGLSRNAFVGWGGAAVARRAQVAPQEPHQGRVGCLPVTRCLRSRKREHLPRPLALWGERSAIISLWAICRFWVAEPGRSRPMR